MLKHTRSMANRRRTKIGGGERLAEIAEEAVRDCLAKLPMTIRVEAERIPCLMREWHPDVADGDETARELLGEYIGYEEDRVGELYGPIVLYLRAIQLYCREEGLCFEEEVRVTYLHELGHHFGWDENDIAERGL